MQIRALRTWIGVGALPALMMVVGVGCSPDLDTYCEERASCRGGNDQDIEACVVSLETNQDFVEELGCGEEFDVFYECFLDKASCVSQATGGSCQTDDECFGGLGTCNADNECEVKDFGFEDPDDCEAESNAYQRCIDLD